MSFTADVRWAGCCTWLLHLLVLECQLKVGQAWEPHRVISRSPMGFSGPDSGRARLRTRLSASRLRFLARVRVIRRGQGYIVRQRQTAGDYVNFDYTEGASQTQASALGVGISGYGVDAGYNGAGSHASSASRSAGFPNAYGNAWFRTEFSTGQYRGICYGPPNDSNIPYEHQHGACPRKFTQHGVVFYVHKCFWLVQSTGWFGGTSTVQPRRTPGTPADNCAPYEKG